MKAFMMTEPDSEKIALTFGFDSRDSKELGELHAMLNVACAMTDPETRLGSRIEAAKAGAMVLMMREMDRDKRSADEESPALATEEQSKGNG